MESCFSSHVLDAKIYVAGPSCQFATPVGDQLGVDDPRINVLWACVDRVVVLAKRGVLVLAVLEEVKELFSLRYCKDGWDEYGARTIGKEVLRRLREGCDGYTSDVKAVNSGDKNAAQERHRIFFVTCSAEVCGGVLPDPLVHPHPVAD